MLNHENITKDCSRAEKFFENIISYTVGAFTLEDMIKHRLDKINIADARDYSSYIEGHIPYAVHIPCDDIKKHLKMLDKSKVTIIYTRDDACIKAYNAALELSAEKYPCAVLRGGFEDWKKHNLDIVKTSSQSE